MFLSSETSEFKVRILGILRPALAEINALTAVRANQNSKVVGVKTLC